jgi:hypothetical protein
MFTAACPSLSVIKKCEARYFVDFTPAYGSVKNAENTNIIVTFEVSCSSVDVYFGLMGSYAMWTSR